MVCSGCGKESPDEFSFCPHCGKILIARPSANESSSPLREKRLHTEIETQGPESARAIAGDRSNKVGTYVFGAFSVVALLVSLIKGVVPIFLLESAVWAGAAWYWHRKKTHTELAKAIVIVLAALVAIGEVIQIAVLADSRYRRIASTGRSQPATPADQMPPDLSDIWRPGAQGSKAANSGCPTALPSGIDSKPLGADEAPNVIGTDGSLISEQVYDSDWAPNGRAWNADLTYTNRTNKCVSLVVVELQLSRAGIDLIERHRIVFQPLLGPGQSQTVEAKLKIVTSVRSEEVALLGWRTIKASGFDSGANTPTYDDNGFQIVKNPKAPIAAYSGHEIKPSNPTNLNTEAHNEVNISADAARRRLLQKSGPVYPPIAMAAGVSGAVVLQATISKAGTVEQLEVVSGPPMLRQAALDAVKLWRYKPYLVSNTAAEVRTQVIVVFSLGG